MLHSYLDYNFHSTSVYYIMHSYYMLSLLIVLYNSGLALFHCMLSSYYMNLMSLIHLILILTSYMSLYMSIDPIDIVHNMSYLHLHSSLFLMSSYYYVFLLLCSIILYSVYYYYMLYLDLLYYNLHHYSTYHTSYHYYFIHLNLR